MEEASPFYFLYALNNHCCVVCTHSISYKQVEPKAIKTVIKYFSITGNNKFTKISPYTE